LPILLHLQQPRQSLNLVFFLEGQLGEVSPTRVQREYFEQGGPNPGLPFSFSIILLFTIKLAKKSQVIDK
jgi:hypothetical protein